MSLTVEQSTMPVRSLEQRRAALVIANDVRIYRAGLKHELRGGRIRVVDLLDDPRCQTMKVWDALIALPKVGRVKANRTLLRMRMSPSKTFGGLSDRQRDDLLEVLS